MAILKKCDICGKIESKDVLFTDGEIKLQIPTYTGETYNVFLTMEVENNKDTQNLADFYKTMSNKEVMQEAAEKAMLTQFLGHMMQGHMAKSDIAPPELVNPFPMMCDKCKRGLMFLALRYGKTDKIEKF